MRRVLLALLLGGCVSPPRPPSPLPPVARAAAPDAPPPAAAADPPALFRAPEFVATDTAFLAAEEPPAACSVSQDNLDRDLAAVLALAPPPPVPPSPDWDRRAPPRYRDLVQRRLRLRPDEDALLRRNGFVVLGRAQADSFAWQFHELYQSQLPLYVSADAVLHAVYLTHDHLLDDLEQSSLGPALAELTDALHDALVAHQREYPPEVVRDLDLYLAVGRSLLRESPVPSRFGADAERDALLQHVRAADGIQVLRLFGRQRRVDFSQYTPRGHYADEGSGARYFQSAMWFSRVEFNVLSRSCQSSAPELNSAPTPREALDALALADLADRAHALDRVDRLERAWSALAGRREDLSVRDLLALRDQHDLSPLARGSASRLEALLADRPERAARLHPMPEGSTRLPLIATLLGPRVTLDTEALRALVHPEVPDRHLPEATDLAFALGIDRAARYSFEGTAPELLEPALASARHTLDTLAPERSLYDSWLAAVRGFGAREEPGAPSFTRTAAWADLRINSAVAGYAQLRHNYVLVAGQSYDVGGCVIPDAWVEPSLPVWDALVAYAERALDAADALPTASPGPTAAWLRRQRDTFRALRAIAAYERSGAPLPPSARRWLGLVAEARPGSSDGSPTYTGWYFDLFRQRAEEGLADARMIADYATSWYEERVAYAGVDRPRLGVFVVDRGGPPRVMVGPVATAYAHTGSTDHRLTDEASRDLPDDQRRRPWAASYEAPTVPEPPLRVAWTLEAGVPRLVLASDRPLGDAVVEPLDHHRTALRALHVRVSARPVTVLPGESVARIRVGRWDTVLSAGPNGGTWRFGGLREVPEAAGATAQNPH